MAEIPLGRSESQDLEFKSRSVLDHPRNVVRAVVAMLNAQGGTVWLGLREDAGRAVEVEAIPDPDRAHGVVRDALMDAMDPPPNEEEVVVETVPAGPGQSVLRVRISPNTERRPYARLSGAAREYLLRVGDRIRPMTREEIQDQMRNASRAREDRPARAIEELVSEQERARSHGKHSLLMTILPVERFDIDLQDAEVRAWLQDPHATGNRPEGWIFATRYVQPRLEAERIVLDAKLRTEIHEDGRIVCTAPLDVLQHGGGEREIWPYALAEYPVSLLRLASRVCRRRGGAGSQVLVDLALFGLRGWRLRPGSPRSFAFQHLDAPRVFEDHDLVRARPFVFGIDELVRQPDRCGFRLVRWVYQAFGLEEEAVPREFDRASGRLVMGG